MRCARIRSWPGSLCGIRPEYPGEFVARLVTDAPTSYVRLADTLAGVQAQLPTDLVRSDRQPADL
jgi:hypothetical protein